MNVADEKLKPAVVYVSLDCLLDTRLGTLALHDEQLAINALLNGYVKRDTDSFDGLSQEQFAKLYAKRDVETLQRSVLTNMILVLKGIVKGTYDDLFAGGQNSGVEFVINTHPYDLSDEEIDLIIKSISVKTFKSATIKAIRISDEFLTPSYCKDNFAMMIMYSYVQWFEMHVKAFETTQMPTVAVIAPALYSKVPSKDEFEEMKAENMHPFRAAEISVAPLFCLRLLDAEMFSIHGGIKPGQPKPSEPEPDKVVEQSVPEKPAADQSKPSSSPATGDDELL